jgi:hypothetical protein
MLALTKKRTVPSPVICTVDECHDNPVVLETEFGVVGSGANLPLNPHC